MGKNCSIQNSVEITDPLYVRMGNNDRLSGCTFFGRDDSINMLNRAFVMKLDSAGKIDIHNNVFIGHCAIEMPGVTIGPKRCWRRWRPPMSPKTRQWEVSSLGGPAASTSWSSG